MNRGEWAWVGKTSYLPLSHYPIFYTHIHPPPTKFILILTSTEQMQCKICIILPTYCPFISNYIYFIISTPIRLLDYKFKILNFVFRSQILSQLVVLIINFANECHYFYCYIIKFESLNNQT